MDTDEKWIVVDWSRAFVSYMQRSFGFGVVPYSLGGWVAEGFVDMEPTTKDEAQAIADLLNAGRGYEEPE